jgi:hypothetical protein
MTDVTDVKKVLELMQITRYEASLAELNNTLVELLTNQSERDLSTITQAMTAALAAQNPLDASHVSVPVTVQPAQVVIQPPDMSFVLDVEFRRSPINDQITGMVVRRIPA